MIFDIDDTLLRTHPVAYRKSVLTAHALGVRPPSVRSFRRMFGRLSFEECLRNWHPQVSPEDYSHVYDSMSESVPYLPVDGARSTLDELREQGTTIAVLTNGPGVKTVRKLAALGIGTHQFAFVRHADNARHLKPHREAFVDLVSDYGVDPCGSVYVSDLPADGIGARAAGFGFIGVLTGLWSAADFHSAGIPETDVLESVRHIGQVLSAR
ncbi:HAD family hydrolase [Streptomyces cellostaticus]|uniref:HAD family hydrolase n=1 Tax=Streptomyces cellostaticus TaxID=67285 RepID=UPI0020269F5B|nr:HAD hydrolase-like protein [Streptomyces cellostaticus]